MLQHDERLSVLNLASWALRLVALDAAGASPDQLAEARDATLDALAAAYTVLGSAQAAAELHAAGPSVRGCLEDAARGLYRFTRSAWRSLAEHGEIRLGHDDVAGYLRSVTAAAEQMARVAAALPAGPPGQARQPAADGSPP